MRSCYFALFLIFCVSEGSFAKSSKKEEVLLKNWDTVNKTLDQYVKKSVNIVYADFGDDYTQTEEGILFYTPSGDSSIKFSVKKDKITDFSYDGIYSDLTKYLEGISSFKNAELQMACEAWLGFSPDLLRETFGSLVLDVSDKNIRVGHTTSAFIDFNIATVESGQPGTSSGPAKRYIKKVFINGSYDDLKNCILKVPTDSIQIKKNMQKY